MGDFSGWFDLSFHPIKTKLLGHRRGGTSVVASEHDDFRPKRVEFADGFERRGFDRVGDGEDSGWFAIYGDEHRGLALLLKFHGRAFQGLQTGNLLLPQKIRLTDHHRATSDGAGNTARRHRAEVFHGLENDTLLLRALHNRGGQRVFAVLL